MVTDARKESADGLRRIHTKVDDMDRRIGADMRGIDRQLGETTIAFRSHQAEDEKDFKDVRKRLDVHDGRWWKVLTGGAAGGGVLAGIIEILTRKSGG